MADEYTEIQDTIKKFENDIMRTQIKIQKLQKRLSELDAKKLQEKEKIFFEKYGKSSEEVRKSYVSRMSKLYEVCGVAHYVKILPFDLTEEQYSANLKKRFWMFRDLISPGASHWCLPRKNYELATLTSMEYEAYKLVGKQIWIDPKPHTERWGN